MIALLPSAATLGNLICGFLAILCCLLSMRANYFQMPSRAVPPQLAEFFPSYLATGVYLILVAMIFDALDGRLARLARRTSEFGAQLDSLSDIVSFGVAPALLMITLLLRLAVPPEGEAIASALQWRLGMTACLIYLTCAAIRLARYNAENVKDESGQQRFCGLPSPGAAAAFAALLLPHEHLIHSGLESWAATLRWIAIPTIAGLGGLMVSRLDYVHVFNNYVRRDQPPSHLIFIVAALALGWYSLPILLLVVAYAYVISGLLLNGYRRWSTTDRPAGTADRTGPGDDGASSSTRDEPGRPSSPTNTEGAPAENNFQTQGANSSHVQS